MRDRALHSAEALARQMDCTQLSAHFVPLLKEMLTKDWYTARGACALLIPCVHAGVDEEQRRQLLQLLTACSGDATPSVRRAAARSLPKVAANAGPQQLQELATLLSQLGKDEQDSIRIQALSAAVALSPYLSPELQTQVLVPAAVAWAADRSWRVRWSLGHHLHELAAHLASASSSSSGEQPLSALCTVYDSLLNDAEPEVRASSAAHFSALCATLPRASIFQLLSSVQRLAGDASDFVRAAAASELALLCSHLAREDVLNLVLPSLLALLRDERSDVRLNIIAALPAINAAIGAEALAQSLLPALSELGMDAKWRVRLAVIEHMPMIARQLGQAFFSAQLVSLCLHWLTDRVYFVRKAAARSLCQLTVLFGADWAAAFVVPALLTMRGTSACSQRLTILAVAQALLAERALPLDGSMGAALSALVLDMAADPVANVRLCVAKTLGQLLKRTDKLELRAVLLQLTQDTDRDVRYSANKVSDASSSCLRIVSSLMLCRLTLDI